jgi:hypothetical protein
MEASRVRSGVEQSHRSTRIAGWIEILPEEFTDSMKKALSLAVLLFVVPLGLTPARAHAQSSATPDPLFQTIQSLDTKLFDAYNHCDLTTLASLVSEDLEFYHDKTGLARGRHSFIDSIKNNICGKVTRDLVPGTLQVYPLAHYGAVEIGTHRFRHPGRDDEVGEAQFITLWQNKGDAWQVTRVISFDHRAQTK